MLLSGKLVLAVRDPAEVARAPDVELDDIGDRIARVGDEAIGEFDDAGAVAADIERAELAVVADRVELGGGVDVDLRAVVDDQPVELVGAVAVPFSGDMDRCIGSVDGEDRRRVYGVEAADAADRVGLAVVEQECVGEYLGGGCLDEVRRAAVGRLRVLAEKQSAAGDGAAFEDDLAREAGRFDDVAVVDDGAVDRGAEAVVELQRGVGVDVERSGGGEIQRGAVRILQRARFDGDVVGGERVRGVG